MPNESIQCGVAGSPLANAEPFIIEASDCGLKPHFDETRFYRLLDELDSETAAEKLSRG